VILLHDPEKASNVAALAVWREPFIGSFAPLLRFREASTGQRFLRSLANSSRFSRDHSFAPRSQNLDAPNRLTSDQKLELFRKLFHGRQDIYAIRWQGASGRSGYAVACENEWAPGICQKPRIKCGECPHRKFKPLDFNAVYDHLSGKHVAGLYPLLPDSSCYLLAVDFDKDDWRADGRALAQACRGEGMPYLIEVSQSGAGAHLWIFFSADESVARHL